MTNDYRHKKPVGGVVKETDPHPPEKMNDLDYPQTAKIRGCSGDVIPVVDGDIGNLFDKEAKCCGNCSDTGHNKRRCEEKKIYTLA